MKTIITALIVLSVLTAGNMMGPFPKTRRKLKHRRCPKAIVVPPLVCPEIPVPGAAPEKLKTPKQPKSFIDKMINVSIKDLLKTLIMTIVSLVAKVLFEKRTFQTKVIRLVASFLRLIMTIGGYAATDVLSVCILATLKNTFLHLLYKVLLVRSYRTLLKHNFKYLLTLGISKMKKSQSEVPTWNVGLFFRQIINIRFSLIISEAFMGYRYANAQGPLKKRIPKKTPSSPDNKLIKCASNVSWAGHLLSEKIDCSKKKRATSRSNSFDPSVLKKNSWELPKERGQKGLVFECPAVGPLFHLGTEPTQSFTNKLPKNLAQL